MQTLSNSDSTFSSTYVKSEMSLNGYMAMTLKRNFNHPKGKIKLKGKRFDDILTIVPRNGRVIDLLEQVYINRGNYFKGDSIWYRYMYIF